MVDVSKRLAIRALRPTKSRNASCHAVMTPCYLHPWTPEAIGWITGRITGCAGRRQRKNHLGWGTDQ